MCLVTDRALLGDAPAERVARCVAAGVGLVQVRERALEGAALLAHVDAIVGAARAAAAARGGSVRVVVNRRVDVALAAGADGVHLGFDGMSVAQARALLGPEAWIGVSAHAPGEVAAAAREGATYAHLAPIFAPLSKAPERPALGLGPLREAASCGIPVLAQGGITPERAPACLAAGAAGFALTGALLHPPDPTPTTHALTSLRGRSYFVNFGDTHGPR